MESNSLGSNHKGVVGILVSSGFGVFENKDANLWADFICLVSKTYPATKKGTSC